ncbi:ATP-binding protein [Leptothoe kymatousa]|uniref:histidine kinase n=1 Tax=Leptothoe kymatousa TAU-MAC 1615 TaxID=2364775 RepID=A0ABS5XZC8_9CYAN|nr:ATP-binding protein [Leptothoe kymatousa]MBT9310962.1 GHKL domain-containing protein [Leptothoe kymatousa TAU-MAC 1615]
MVCSDTTFEMLANSRQLWPQLFNHLNTAIHLKTLNGKWIYANHASQKLWNHGPIDLGETKTDTDCLPPEKIASFTQADAQIIEQKSPVEFTSHSDNQTIIVRKSLIALATNKSCILTECQTINHPINPETPETPAALEATLQELQQTQLQLVQHEKMSSLGQLMAGVAHEINNPVNFIYGNIRHAQSYVQELIELISAYRGADGQPNDVVQTLLDDMDLDFMMVDLPKVLSSMSVGAERIRAIVSSLRTFSRMDEAKMKTVNLHDGLNSTLMILEHRFKATTERAAITIQKQYGELPPVECYPGQLNQVFMNLLVNAIDAIEDAMATEAMPLPLQITISTQADQAMAIIAIHNDGPPIPQSIQPRLFDPFFTTKPVGKGTGMGLSISYQIINERHGGQLSCESDEHIGTTFTIRIPLMTQTKKQDAPMEHPAKD